MKVGNFLLETNVFISSAALLLTVETQIQLGLKPGWHPYLFIIFFATMFEYNFHKLVTITFKKEALKSEKNRWIREHLWLFYCMAGISVAGFIAAIFMAKREVLIALAPIAAITIFYSFPLFRKKNFIFRLREIPLLKIFLIAIVWSSVTILLPVIHSDIRFERSEIWLLFVERALFVLAITVPFDIRDMDVDRLSGIVTLPLWLGERKANQIALWCMVFFSALVIWHYVPKGEFHLVCALIFSAVSTSWFLVSEKLKRSKYYYYGVLDGTLVLQGILVILFYGLFGVK